MKSGMERGIERGIQRGEHSKAVEATKKLLKMKILTHEQIAEAEGITVEEVIKIAEELN